MVLGEVRDVHRPSSGDLSRGYADRYLLSRSVDRGLVAAYGPDNGLDATSEAMAYAWEHWDEVATMKNPAGYLYRVGQTAARNLRRSSPMFPAPPAMRVDGFVPELLPALDELSEMQRVCVVMVHGHGWRATEVAEVLEVNVSSVRTHVKRALSALKSSLEISHDRV